MSRQRLKLLLINTKLTIQDVSIKLRSLSETELDFTFYNISLDDDGKLEASYSEKIEVSDNTYDRYGNLTEEISFTTYRNIEISIQPLGNRKLLMVIYNPPKTIKSLIENICETFDYQIGFFTPELDLKMFKQNLESDLKVELENTGKIKVNRITIDNSAKASIEVTSSKNALRSLESLVNGKDYMLEKISSSVNKNGHTIDFDITKSCNIKIRTEYLELLMPSIEKTLVFQ